MVGAVLEKKVDFLERFGRGLDPTPCTCTLLHEPRKHCLPVELFQWERCVQLNIFVSQPAYIHRPSLGWGKDSDLISVPWIGCALLNHKGPPEKPET